ncbi:MAG: cytochrome c3 family protein, partial [Pseudomonadota bacterium]
DYETLLSEREFPGLTFAEDDIPKDIMIGTIEKEYEPSKFPHRKIISALMKNIIESRLAKYFHGSEDTACYACHHHNPEGKKPIACSSCHGRTSGDDGIRSGMPGLKSAYHLQCIGCHKAMGIEKLSDCEACHKKKPE